MKITNQTKETIVCTTTTVEVEADVTVTVIDFVNDEGRIINSIYRDVNGYEIDDPCLVEEIEDFMAKQLLPKDK